MGQIYISNRDSNEHRLIVVDNNELMAYEQEWAGKENKRGNIYMGVVTRLEPSLDAAFVDYGERRDGLLPLRQVPEGIPGVSPEGLQAGDALLVQIKKDNIGSKGAGLTGFISLAGHYLILQPYRDKSIAISRQASQAIRGQMREVIESLNLPENMNVIVRTGGVRADKEQLTWDLEKCLLQLWNDIQAGTKEIKQPTLIYRANSMLLRGIRDYYRPGKDGIFCDNKEIFDKLHTYMSRAFPEYLEDLHYHAAEHAMVPQNIDVQIDMLYQREISSPSGVRVVFDSTEALVAVDVNSGKMRETTDIETTALKVNMEAAEIIARQLRLRNLGGLIVVDFIDMESEENRSKLEKHFAQQIRHDRAQIRFTDISKFGLIEISRQRISKSLATLQKVPCLRCQGSGEIWESEAFSDYLMHKIRRFSTDDKTDTLVAQVPTETAIHLLNERRGELQMLEESGNCDIFIIPDESLQSPQFFLKPHFVGGARAASNLITGAHRNQQKQKAVNLATTTRQQRKKQAPQPQSEGLIESMTPPSQMIKQESSSWLKKVLGSLFSSAGQNGKQPPRKDASYNPRRQQRRGYQKNRSNRPRPPEHRNNNKSAKNNSDKPPLKP